MRKFWSFGRKCNIFTVAHAKRRPQIQHGSAHDYIDWEPPETTHDDLTDLDNACNAGDVRIFCRSCPCIVTVASVRAKRRPQPKENGDKDRRIDAWHGSVQLSNRLGTRRGGRRVLRVWRQQRQRRRCSSARQRWREHGHYFSCANVELIFVFERPFISSVTRERVKRCTYYQ